MINVQYVVITIMKLKKGIGPVTLENCTGVPRPSPHGSWDRLQRLPVTLNG